MTIGAPPVAQDSFEPNDDAAITTLQPAGAVNSPNLGPVNPSRTVSSLSIHDEDDVDWFRFYANETGGAGDSVSLSHNAGAGDLDLELRDASGALIASSEGLAVDQESISLEGRPEGWYFAVVRGKLGATNTPYSLTIEPPANQSPSIAITAPTTGNVDVIHALETFNATWSVSDPESDSTWVTLWLNKTNALDGQQVLLETSLFTPGEEGFHIVNTSHVSEGTYWLYAEVTDGGTTVGQWSDGTIVAATVPSPGAANGVTCD